MDRGLDIGPLIDYSTGRIILFGNRIAESSAAQGRWIMRGKLIVLFVCCTFAWLGCDSSTDENGGVEVAAEEDLVSGAEDLSQPAEDLVEEFEDVTETPEDTVAPEEDLVVPPEDVVEPPEDIVEPPEDVQISQDVAVSAGACDNPTDLQTLGAVEGTLKDTIAGCAMSCIGQGVPCMADCVKDGTGLSDGCSNCFGEVIDCTISKCMFQCMDSSSPACAECQEQHCAAAFTDCAGIPMTQ